MFIAQPDRQERNLQQTNMPKQVVKPTNLFYNITSSLNGSR